MVFISRTSAGAFSGSVRSAIPHGIQIFWCSARWEPPSCRRCIQSHPGQPVRSLHCPPAGAGRCVLLGPGTRLRWNRRGLDRSICRICRRERP
jgi:hypothetical protein